MSRRWLAFAALCALSASAWMVDEYLQLPLTGLVRQAAHAALLAGIFFALAKPRRARTWPRTLVSIALWTALLVPLPAVILTAAAGHLTSSTSVLLFTLIPAVTVFLTAQSRASFGDEPSFLQPLAPALAALAGAALLLPFSVPSSRIGLCWLAAVAFAAILSALAAIRLHPLLAGQPLLASAAALSTTVAITCAAFAWLDFTLPTITRTGILVEALVCLALDGPILLLTTWLLRELTPTQFSTRYLLIPLITVAEGFLLLRPTATWTMLLGAVLLAGGSLMLLRSEHQT